ncbi:MAG: bifunctional YncE family protein/alkaline phosphatase family protein [Gemmatimonadaceae bacterium]
MIHLALALLIQAQATPPAPRRNVPDPGVIATGQRVSPAGVQSVFTGRVAGVRFGASSDEVWVVAPSATYRLDWRGNAVRASVRLDGTPGVHGIAIDPSTQRAYVSSVGRLPAVSSMPGAPATRQPAVTYLSALDANITGEGATPQWRSTGLGDYMAGSPAIATRAAPDGKRYAALPLPANDALAVIDADRGTHIRTIPLGVEPIAAVIAADGRTAWVSILGGAKPTAADRSTRQCCDPRVEAVRVDARGIAEAGSVSRVDLVSGTVTADIKAGRHPTALAWDRRAQLLYVADGNSDSVTVIDTKSAALAARIAIAPFRQRLVGLAPTALALTPDGRTLFVALGGANAVAMYDVANGAKGARLLGLIPTAWYPSSLDVSADGKFLAVGALLGVGSGEGATAGKRGHYVHAVRGSLNVLAIPSAAELNAFSTAVATNNRLTLASSAAPRELAASNTPRAVPQRPGDPSLIKHVVFIIRENRTYDQVLGDLDRGARDSSLVTYGRDVTPNAHALSEQFVTLDHFFASGGNSADGHNWLTQANETDYPMWPLYFGRSYPSEGADPLAYSSGGFLWDAALSRNKSVVVFGEYAPGPRTNSSGARDTMLTKYFARPDDFAYHRELLRDRYDTRSPIPSLDHLLVPEYPGWTQEAPDVVKAGDILYHLGEWEKARAMPNLTMIILPSDHTEGTSAGWCAPKACVADNDLALGNLVQGLSHSSFWKDMAILVVEDDAQNGVDHIDGHRTVALAISPYARRGVVDSTFYVQPSMLKTIELMLGLPALSIFDLVATDMRASFTDTPDLAPYTAVMPKQSLLDKNRRATGYRGPDAALQRQAALASARMRFDVPDAAPSEALNRILWHDAKGWKVPYPTVRRSLFFPMSVDIADEDRDEKEARRPDK